MKKKKTVPLFVLGLMMGSSQVDAQKTLPVMNAIEKQIISIEDGIKRPWFISADVRPDVLRTSARNIEFRSKIDSIAFTLNEGDTFDFVILTAAGDSAFTRIKWVSNNPLQNPPKEILGLSPTGRMSRHQAEFDIDALVYNISEIHPNMYAQIGMKDFMQCVSRVKAELPDSLTKIELYERAAPLVTMLGDGHSMMRFPFNDIFTSSLKRLPLTLKIDDNSGRITIIRSCSAEIPDSVELVSINGVSTSEMIDWMMQYSSGERDFFRRERINELFSALFEMHYSTNQYDVEFLVGKKTQHAVIPAMTLDEMKAMAQSKYQIKTQKRQDNRPYFYKISDDGKYAILTFNACVNPGQMATMADSMVNDLNSRGVRNLIIDIRANGGGISSVGNELLSRISSVPFSQFGGAYVRTTPTTLNLIKQKNETGIVFFDNPKLIEPLVPEKRFTGKIYLLTSHATFSSAASFSWAFKEFNVGTIIGEETGGMNVCFGDFLRYYMPVSGLLTTISFKRFWQYGADERNIHGTLPHYNIPADKAMDYVKRKIKAKK